MRTPIRFPTLVLQLLLLGLCLSLLAICSSGARVFDRYDDAQQQQQPRLLSQASHNTSSGPAGAFPQQQDERFRNPSLAAAFWALQAWKKAITSDPKNITGTWVGYDVCQYSGVSCAPPPDNCTDLVVSGIDLNHANLSGTLPDELGELDYLAFFHINTNRFSGTLPSTISCWHLLYELDVSNNLFSGPFPEVTLDLPSLVYLDVRFNSFEGALPKALFNKKLDALFVNHNSFQNQIPSNLGNSTVSVVVFASNNLVGGIPSSIGQMTNTLNEIIFLDNSFQGCVPSQLGALGQLTVLDLSFNNLSGVIPSSISNMTSLQQLDVSHNLLTGNIPEAICALPHLENFTASFNYFTGEASNCLAFPSGDIFNDTDNCIPWRPSQRSAQECAAFFLENQACPAPKPPPPPPPPSPPPPSPPPPSPPPPCPPPPSPPPPCSYPPPADHDVYHDGQHHPQSDLPYRSPPPY